ncbi:hypothetical protein PF001_g33347 [Phytophthora fragariae]|uniref:Uncharacterized protein n=1 Tax=Phytophthora fragariae TaxID=53985 RepID=A0A6A4AI75_9STRA|nr:hypothetical protein PF001_g33347 [Phytophthora fragariae]
MATYGPYVESVEIDQFKGLGMAQRGEKRAPPASRPSRTK